MKVFNKISDLFYLNKLKESFYRADEKGLTEEETKDLNNTKPQNPFGMIALVAGGASISLGLTIAIIPIVTITFCILTFGTFDKTREDNPWTFYLGFSLALIGLLANLSSGGSIQMVI